MSGFNSGWTGTMNKRPSLFVILEGFLNKESWSQQILREDSVAVGGNSISLNTSRHKASVQKRLDLKALCEDYYTMQPATYLDSLVKFFND
jgi:hypothetical protein